MKTQPFKCGDWRGGETMASSALTLPGAGTTKGLQGKTGRERKVVLGALFLQSIEMKVVPRRRASHKNGEGPAENPCTSPKQPFSQPLSVSGEKLAKGLKAGLRDSVGKVAQPVLRPYISMEK